VARASGGGSRVVSSSFLPSSLVLVAFAVPTVARQAPAEDASVPPGATEILGGLEVTVFANTLGRRDDTGLFDADGNHLDDRVSLRSLGLRLTAPVEDLGRGLAFLRWSEEPDGTFESFVDEAWFESAPLEAPWEWLSRRLTVRVGRFRAPIGQSNPWHLHEIPQITRPLPVREILGEDGLVQTGVAGTLAVPTGLEWAALDFTMELARDYPLDEAFTPLLDLDLALHATPRDRFDLGLTVDNTRSEREFGFQSNLLALDVLYTHRPASAESAGTFHLGGEFLRSNVSLPTENQRPIGGTAWCQLEFLPDWFAGARLDQSDRVTDDTLESRLLGGYLSWAAHPRLRMALGYEHTTSDDPALDGLDSVLVELNIDFGSPAPAPPWLAR